MSETATLYKTAFAAFTRGEHTAAIDGFKKVIEIAPDFVLAYQGLAEVYGRQKQLDLAIETIQQAINLEPDESLYYTSLSRFLQRQGRVPEAETAAAEAARLQSS